MMVRVQYSIGVEAFPALACNVIAVIGAVTAVIAAFMATQQNDIKRVLAYSTLSQLGYMVMALGLLAGEAAMFHLFTHAWFKALLFLGAGAIIFPCHHEQDIWKMGGIMKRMKLTSLTFIIATMALVAIPFTSGFFSKEAILEAALHKNPVFFWIGAGVALLTTFYMMRVIFVVFFGKSRSHSSEHATEVGGLMLVPLLILAVLALISGYGFMADRLVPFNGFVSESFHIGMPFYVSMGALVLGILLAAVFYAGSPASDKLSGNAVSRALANRLYIDWFYDKVLVRGIQGSLAAIIDFMDQFIISGLIVGGLEKVFEINRRRRVPAAPPPVRQHGRLHGPLRHRPAPGHLLHRLLFLLTYQPITHHAYLACSHSSDCHGPHRSVQGARTPDSPAQRRADAGPRHLGPG